MNHAASPRIRVLPSQVANQIAAGEVVERPASVVKELLENSLDAGANSIEVEIEQGGVKGIRIRDDGHGIHRDDLLLALSPHATSKIVTADDLDGVTSLGFRGEALASIASVAHLSLTSRRSDDEMGWRITGEKLHVSPVPFQRGTEVEVHDLFFNTPARRKFLRSERTEYSHVEEVVRRIALSRFDLAVRFIHNGKQVLRVRASSTGGNGTRRVAEVLGNAFSENSVEVDVTAGGLRLWGWLGRDGYSRSQVDIQYFYLNGRMIRDRLASHAVRLAFGERIAEGRYPAYLLYLELDPRLVDVNVHPTKHEVRFREARQVHDFIYWAVNCTLEGNNKTSPDISNAPALHHTTAPDSKEQYRVPLCAVREKGVYYGIHKHNTPSHSGENNGDLGHAICQLRSGYLIAERGETTVIIDLRAMMSELHYRRLTASEGEALLAAQPLLIPESRALDSDAARRWREQGAMLESFGFEFGWLGEELLVLRKVPAIVRSGAISSLLQALQTWLWEPAGNATDSSDKLLRLLASHAVPVQLPAYSLADLNALLREYETAITHTDGHPWRELDADGWQRLFEYYS